MVRKYNSFFFIACLLRQIWRFWKWKYFHSRCCFQQKNYLKIGNFISTFCHVLRYNRNGTFYKLNSLHEFFINLKLGVTWSHFPIQNEMKLLPWQTNCLHSSNKVPVNLNCELVLPANNNNWSHNNNPFREMNQLLEPVKYILKFILSQNLIELSYYIIYWQGCNRAQALQLNYWLYRWLPSP